MKKKYKIFIPKISSTKALVIMVTIIMIAQQQFNQKQKMEDDLIMNRLPLPKYYDGNEWNTVIKPTRKSIPKYLHEDLPELKHIYIKQKFKEIGKFNCPKLEYFDNMIKKKIPPKPIEKKPSKKKQRTVSYQQVKEQLQYALIIGDRNSNIVDGLLDKAKKCQDTQKSNSSIRKKKKRMSLDRGTGKYFGNTVDLVFRQRKKDFLNQLHREQGPDLEEIQKRVANIKLISFQ